MNKSCFVYLLFFLTAVGNIFSQPVLTYKTKTINAREIGLSVSSYSTHTLELNEQDAAGILNSMMHIVAATDTDASTSATMSHYASQQEKDFRDSEDAEQIMQELAMTRQSLAHYRQLINNGTSIIVAVQQTWDALTPQQQQMTSLEAFQDMLETYGASDEAYKKLLARLPADVDDIVTETRPRWQQESALQALRDRLTSTTELSSAEFQNIQDSDKINIFYQNDPARALDLKKSHIVEKHTVAQFRQHGVFASRELEQAFNQWWSKRSSHFSQVFNLNKTLNRSDTVQADNSVKTLPTFPPGSSIVTIE